jgi:hypothetical protein
LARCPRPWPPLTRHRLGRRVDEVGEVGQAGGRGLDDQMAAQITLAGPTGPAR